MRNSDQLEINHQSRKARENIKYTGAWMAHQAEIITIAIIAASFKVKTNKVPHQLSDSNKFNLRIDYLRIRAKLWTANNKVKEIFNLT